MSDIAIKVENLSKYYKLGVINNGTLFRDIQSYMARLRGKEDPHAKLGNNYDDNAEGFWALKDLNFEIRKGDRVGIIGHNGAGKSTLLKVLSQITSPTEGFIKLNGRIASLLEVGTGFHPELTGRENIYMNGAILGMKKAEIDKKVEQIIEFSEIGKHIDTPVKRYSSGMYVRLAFAVAAHLDSEILIADEVLAVGDANFQKKALGKMNELSRGQGRTVLFVSHQIPAVISLCNKGVYLEKGHVIPTNSLNDCIDYYYNSALNEKNYMWNAGIESEYIKLNSVSLTKSLDKKDVFGIFEKGEKFFVNIDYEIIKENKEYIFAVDIINNTGNSICVNSASDLLELDEYNRCISIGKHCLQLEIDSSIFGVGTYYLKFDIAIHNVICFTVDNPVLTFDIIQKDNKQARFLTEQRKEKINPSWRWIVY